MFKKKTKTKKPSFGWNDREGRLAGCGQLNNLFFSWPHYALELLKFLHKNTYIPIIYKYI